MHRMCFAVLALLGCGALQAQTVSLPSFPGGMQDPQGLLAAHQAAQRDAATLEATQGQMAGRTAATIAASVVPGASMAVMAAESAEKQAKQAQAAQRVQSHALQAQQLTAIMPKIMRGQRLIELGAANGCEWIAGASLNAGFQPDGVPSKPESDR